MQMTAISKTVYIPVYYNDIIWRNMNPKLAA